MRISLIDRWTDTLAFRLALLLSALLALPVLAVGVVTSLMGALAIAIGPLTLGPEQAAIGLLSAGGAAGFAGYIRARGALRRVDRHNVTTTLVCLAAGVGAAFVVACIVMSAALEAWRLSGNDGAWLAMPAVFALANVIWAVSGIAWMRRLMRGFLEKTGRAYDGLPVMFLCVALALVIVAALTATTV